MTNNSNTSVTFSLISRGLFAAAGALALTLGACGGNGSVNGNIELIDHRSGDLPGSDLESVNGIYGAGCTDRAGAWSLEIEPGAALDHPELSVVLNDQDCVLTLTELRTVDGALAAGPAIELTASYQPAPSEFGVPVQFYGNAKLSAVGFADDFTLTIVYSDDPALATGDSTAQFEVVEASAYGDSVTAPDYAINPAGLLILVDAQQLVQSVTGAVSLLAGEQAGQTYVVADASGLHTYAELDAAFKAGTPQQVGATVPAADFSLVGEDMDAEVVKRTLILANTENEVASYQAFEITFHPAPTL